MSNGRVGSLLSRTLSTFIVVAGVVAAQSIAELKGQADGIWFGHSSQVNAVLVRCLEKPQGAPTADEYNAAVDNEKFAEGFPNTARDIWKAVLSKEQDESQAQEIEALRVRLIEIIARADAMAKLYRRHAGTSNSGFGGIVESNVKHAQEVLGTVVKYRKPPPAPPKEERNELEEERPDQPKVKPKSEPTPESIWESKTPSNNGGEDNSKDRRWILYSCVAVLVIIITLVVLGRIVIARRPVPKVMSTNQYEYDAFISYNTLDRQPVSALVSALTAVGFRVWFDDQNLVRAAPFPAECASAIWNSRCFVLVLGPRGLGHWQRDEVNEALQVYRQRGSRGISVVTLPSADKNSLPGPLKSIGYIDLEATSPDSITTVRQVALSVFGLSPNAAPEGAIDADWVKKARDKQLGPKARPLSAQHQRDKLPLVASKHDSPALSGPAPHSSGVSGMRIRLIAILFGLLALAGWWFGCAQRPFPVNVRMEQLTASGVHDRRKGQEMRYELYSQCHPRLARKMEEKAPNKMAGHNLASKEPLTIWVPPDCNKLELRIYFECDGESCEGPLLTLSRAELVELTDKAVLYTDNVIAKEKLSLKDGTLWFESFTFTLKAWRP